jgi:methane/ammonia monooxygenase subunit C
MARGSALAVAQVEEGEPTPARATLPAISLKPIWIGLATILVVMASLRIYQQLFAFTKGIDSFSPEFRTYWWNLLLAEWALEITSATLLWGWIWKTRDRAVDKVTPQLELKRYFNLLMWLMAYAFVFFFAGSFFAEQDATWHQTLIRDTEFTPSHIILFYFAMPVAIILGVGGFLYAHTRLPYYDYQRKGWSLPYLLIVVGPALLLVNVAFNEWGHTFWVMEEIFAHPLHWGFVILGWSALAFFGVFLQAVPHILGLIRGFDKTPGAVEQSAT